MQNDDNRGRDRPELVEEITTLLEGACEMYRPTALNLAQEILRIVQEVREEHYKK